MKIILNIIFLLFFVSLEAQQTEKMSEVENYFNQAANEYLYKDPVTALKTLQKGLNDFPGNEKLNALAELIMQQQDQQNQQKKKQQQKQQQEQQKEQKEKQRQKEQEKEENKEQQEQQQQQKQDMDKEDMERLLQAIEDKERKTKDEYDKKKREQVKGVIIEKDW